MTQAVQLRKGTTAEHTSFTGLQAEATVDTTKKTLVVHDGSTAGGIPLSREDLSNSNPSNLTSIAGADTASGDFFVVYDVSASAFKKITRAELNNAMEQDALASVAITGGTINGTTIGGTTAAAGSFTTLTASGNVTLSGGTANGVLYLNGSKVATSGSALTFDGTNLGVGIASPTDKLDASGTSRWRARVTNAYTLQINTNAAGSSYADAWHDASTHLWQVSGSEQMRLTSTGLVINDSARIGSARFSMQVNASTENAIAFKTSTNGEISALRGLNSAGSETVALNYDTTNSAFYFRTANTQRMTLDSSGNLGIGTSSPARKLQVNSSEAVAARFTRSGGIVANNSLEWFDGTNAWYAGVSGSNFWGVAYNSSGAIDNAALRLDSSGNLGLGVTPSAWSQGRAIEVFQQGYGVWNGDRSAYLLANTYFDSGFKYAISGNAASHYYQFQGAHVWSTAPSGTAGNAITFTQAMTLDASGNLIVPYRAVFGQTVSGDSVLQVASAYGGLRIGYNSTNVNYFDGDTQIFRNSAGTTERARITSGGDFYIGTTTNYGRLAVQTDGTNGSVGFVRNTDNAFPATLDFIKSRGSAGSPTAVQSGDDLLLVRTAPYQGSAYTYLNAMAVQVDGTYTSGQNPPTRIIFNTNAANGSSTERARITSGGDLLVGTTSTAAKLTVEQSGFNANGASITNQSYNYQTLGLHNTATANDNLWVTFGTEASFTLRGSIDYNRAGGLTRYNTTSDYRAKDIIGPVQNTGAIIDALKVYEGKMKGATQARPMMVAHEAQAVVPFCVSGVKDETNEDGTPKYQQMDHASLVPLLLAEIQSLRQRVALLEGN